MIGTAAASFEQAWQQAAKVDGWLAEDEARALFNAAVTTPDNGVIVEVGSYKGRSLTVLSETGRQVIAVDPLEVGMSVAKNRITENTVAALARVVDAYPNTTWIRQKSADTKCPPAIDLLYIDGCHRYPSPLEDFRAFEGGLVRGSLIAFHDYGRDFGVTKSVDELIELKAIKWLNKSGTMVVCRYL